MSDPTKWSSEGMDRIRNDIWTDSLFGGVVDKRTGIRHVPLRLLLWIVGYVQVNQTDAKGNSDGVGDGPLARLLRKLQETADKILHRAQWSSDYVRTIQYDEDGNPDIPSDGALAALVRDTNTRVKALQQPDAAVIADRLVANPAFISKLAPAIAAEVHKLDVAQRRAELNAQLSAMPEKK